MFAFKGKEKKRKEKMRWSVVRREQTDDVAAPFVHLQRQEATQHGSNLFSLDD